MLQKQYCIIIGMKYDSNFGIGTIGGKSKCFHDCYYI